MSNVLSIANAAPLPQSGKAGGQMSHTYGYDALYRLTNASGTYRGADNKSASYTLAMSYDNMHRIKSKSQHLTQQGVQFNGTLNAGYDLTYTYQDSLGHKFQLSKVEDLNYRTEGTPKEKIDNGHRYLYDANGNLVYINTSRVKKDGKEDEQAVEKKYRWDEENRLLASDENGFVANYWYDAAGNLLTKLTAQLKASISDKAPITYTYDYERLSEVLYPENLFNRVTYTYGAAGAPYNRAGRLALVEDASGGEAYYYGKQGEVTKTVRTVMASTADIRTYVYGATYDSWNRVRTMTYPDGEIVTYHYNAAGQVESLTSNKLGKESTLIAQVGYDKDGHTVYTKLGNGTETTYTYDNKRERLEEMNLTAAGSPIMQNKYRYDAVDNILGIINTVDPQSQSSNQ